MSGEVHMSGVPLPERPDPRSQSEKARDYLNESNWQALLNERCLDIVNRDDMRSDVKLGEIQKEARKAGMSAKEALDFAYGFDKNVMQAYTRKSASLHAMMDEQAKAKYSAEALPGVPFRQGISNVNPFDTRGAFRKLANGVRVALFGDDDTPKRDIAWETAGQQKLGRPICFVIVETEGVPGQRYHEKFAGRPFFDDAGQAVAEADRLADDPAVRAFVCRAGGELIRVDARARTPKDGLTGFQALQKLGAA